MITITKTHNKDHEGSQTRSKRSSAQICGSPVDVDFAEKVLSFFCLMRKHRARPARLLLRRPCLRRPTPRCTACLAPAPTRTARGRGPSPSATPLCCGGGCSRRGARRREWRTSRSWIPPGLPSRWSCPRTSSGHSLRIRPDPQVGPLPRKCIQKLAESTRAFAVPGERMSCWKIILAPGYLPPCQMRVFFQSGRNFTPLQSARFRTGNV